MSTTNTKKRIASSLFPFSFFLSSRVSITNLEASAIQHGGATKNLITNEAWSNIPQDDYITINPTNNTIAVFIPDTVNVPFTVNGTSSQVNDVSALKCGSCGSLSFPLKSMEQIEKAKKRYNSDNLK